VADKETSRRLADDREPWERQPGETPKQYARFLAYRDLGVVRTLKKCVETQTKSGDPISYRTAQQASWRFGWPVRAEAWDRAQAEQDQAELREARRQMVSGHRRVASVLLGKAVAALRDLDPRAMKPAEVVQMVRLATDIERQALELPSATVALTGPAGGPVQTEDLSQLDGPARRRRLAEIAAELAYRSGGVGDDGDDDGDGPL